MKRSRITLVYLSMLLLMGISNSCDNIGDVDNYEIDAIEDFMLKYDYDIEPTATGLYFEDVEIGTGDYPVDFDTLEVNYIGYFLSGLEFDRNTYGEPFRFTIGNAPYLDVIAGWDEGLRFVKEGGSAVFIIPSWLGYGSQGSGAIPPHTPLFFEVELLSIIPGPNH